MKGEIRSILRHFAAKGKGEDAASPCTEANQAVALVSPQHGIGSFITPEGSRLAYGFLNRQHNTVHFVFQQRGAVKGNRNV